MLRNNVFEWAENYEHEYGAKPGEWRYDLNKDQDLSLLGRQGKAVRRLPFGVYGGHAWHS